MFLARTAPAHTIFNHLVRDFFNDANSQPTPSSEPKLSFVPAVDVIETANSYQLQFDLPGVDPNSIDITVDKGVLAVKGERAISLAEGSKFNRVERARGEFLRKFTLPDGADLNQIQARNAHGVLSIEIAKLAQVEAKRISINSVA